MGKWKNENVRSSLSHSQTLQPRRSSPDAPADLQSAGIYFQQICNLPDVPADYKSAGADYINFHILNLNL